MAARGQYFRPPSLRDSHVVPGALVKEVREALEMRQIDFAAELGISVPVVVRMENRGAAPLYRLALVGLLVERQHRVASWLTQLRLLGLLNDLRPALPDELRAAWSPNRNRGDESDAPAPRRRAS